MMKSSLRERMFLSAVVLALAAVLVALAILQYRWSREVSDATSARLHENLQSSMLSWRDDLYRELTSVFSAMQVDPTLPSRDKAQQYVQEYQTWSQTAAHSNLIAHVFLLQNAGSPHRQFLQLNTAAGSFEPVEWPAELDPLHGWIEDRSSDIAQAIEAASRFKHAEGLHVEHGDRHFRDHQPFNMAMMVPAMIDIKAATLARLQVRHNLSPMKEGEQGEPPIDWIIVQLDRKVFQDSLLPDLVEHHFSGSEGLEYQVAVTGASGSIIYTSDSGFGKQDAASADGVLPLLGPPRMGPPSRRGMNLPFGPPPRHQGGPGHEKGGFGFPGPIRLEAVRYADTETDWQLLVRHRKGSLEAVVTGMRHRNLAFSFGVLLVLAAGIGIIVVSSQRARTLARLQMDFVAAVSHELRTPLAVISSAAENIADGVVAGKKQLTEYGTEIKHQAKHLIQLVEQILLFAATRDERHHYNLRLLNIPDVVEDALKNTAGTIEGAGFTLVQEIAPNLPLVNGDLPALSHCLQNLITNAVKYGGDARWIRIKAQMHEKDAGPKEIQISVEDKGLGIGAAELQRIFEPFYRSRSVASAQIHGTGLGLPLAKDIAEAMGGRLTVSSEPGEGSCFTLYLPVAELVQSQVGTQAAAVNPKLSKT